MASDKQSTIDHSSLRRSPALEAAEDRALTQRDGEEKQTEDDKRAHHPVKAALPTPADHPLHNLRPGDHILDRDFRIRILLPPDQQLKKAKLHCCWQLKHLLREYEQIVKQRLQQSADLSSFILELKTVLEVCLKSHPECRSMPPPQYYSQLISEMETLGWDKMLFIDTNFQTLKLKAEDSSGRQHVLNIKLKSKHPTEAPDCSADLPVPLNINWTPQSTLDQLHSQFLLVLESLAEFWDVLDEIDTKTWILEPERPSRSDTMRRIAIKNNVSIRVEVDPRHPRMLPECCLLGAEHVVTPLRSKLNANMHT
ncbi:E3 ubiquitin-protein ligase FANCL isoform X3 [Austrofundulus limnaeus]|nr:PREDICTED: E3 ubiquitin-protein ligase FANCL isoform X3 [Austrofundulus limnaeus]